MRAWLLQNPAYGMAPSYPTIIRYLRVRGFTKKHRVRSPYAPGRIVAAKRLEEREVRSYEVEYVVDFGILIFTMDQERFKLRRENF